MESENRRWLQHDGGTNQASRAQESRAQPRNHSVHRTELRCALPRTIQDQQLVLEQQRLSCDRAKTARSQHSSDGHDQMDDKDA
jgi:hypothetical protein